MSDYHILTVSDDGNSMRVAAHISVPDVNNDVGVNYRTALVQMLGGEQVSAVPFIEATEQDALNAGELYEYSASFHTWPGETTIQKRDRLDVLYGETVTRIQAVLAYRLSYWGYSRDVS